MYNQHRDERYKRLRKLIMDTATTNYGIRPHDRDNILRISNTLDALHKTDYKFDEIAEGLKVACEGSPKFMPKLQEILVAIKNVLKYMRHGNESNSNDKDYEEAQRQTARRNKQRAWVEANFSDREISKAINLWCAKEKVPRNWGSDLEFYSAVAHKGGYARSLLQEMLEAKKNENTKRESEGQKTATMGEKKAN